MSGITNIQGKILVFLFSNNDLMAAGYDFLCIEKSFNGISGTYTEITSPAAAGATLLSAKKQNYSLNGLDLIFEADGTEYTASFTVEASAAQVAAKITADTTIPAVADGEYVRITSPTSGLNSSLELTKSTAGGSEIGFYNGDWDIGEIIRVLLVADQKKYFLTDYHCSDDYFYRWRLFNSTAGNYSTYSAPFQARDDAGVDPSSLIYGVCSLMSTEGTPMSGVAIVVTHKQLTAAGSKVIDGYRAVYYTDDNGNVFIPFVKKSKVSVAVENTRLVRDITVPDTGDSFDLFSPAIQEYDRWSIAVYSLPDLLRQSF